MNVLHATLATTLWTLVGARNIFCDECWDPHQVKAKCAQHYRYEDTCPGVPFIYCKRGDCKCHCEWGFYRRMDFQCVPERECWPREMKPEQWFRSTDDIYQKWISGYISAYRRYPFRCFKSKYRREVGNTFYRTVQFLMPYKGQVLTRSFNLEIKLEYSPERDKAYIKVGGEAGGKRPPDIKRNYTILYASDHCILIGDGYPGPNQKTNCTCWTTFGRFDNLHWLCEYMSEQYCH
uniref:Putative secreted protein n=1 Tax=Amblyomma parvum TaxID=251391 RepID=A0A023G1D3_AMBPA